MNTYVSLSSITAAVSLLWVAGPVPSNGEVLTPPVSATANIFSAGLSAPVAPGGGGAGTLPILVSLSGGQTAAQFTVSGSVSQLDGDYLHGPDGWTGGGSLVSSYGGISGFTADVFLPLVGVFLTDATPQAPAPSTFNFGNTGLGLNFLTLSPSIGQVFFIGDGKTDSAQTQTFYIPNGATRLFLGFADAPSQTGAPGAYGDNSGSLQVTVVPEPSVCTVTALGIALLAGLLRKQQTP